MGTTEISTTYNPKEIEEKTYQFWLERGYFHAEPDPDPEREHFVILMPPPNITGTLHIGHALDVTIPDILIRWKRMQGANVCWIPGTDHASIATEAKVVASLAKEGLSKTDIGRERFLEIAWEWKEKYGGEIVEQQKKLGASCDWDRKRFTMDPVCSKAVREVFVRLFEKGLIYRGDRMINWCPNCRTSLSDVEVEHEDVESALWHLRYPLADGSGHVVVATTRPETMLGDTAVAVNPKDPRYAKLVGKTLILPIMDREIPIVADAHVDPEFGTGAVKVTPAHDPDDFEIGERHGLASVKVIGPDGIMTEEAGKYAGMTREECRRQVVEELKSAGLLEKIESYEHAVGHCQRCGTAVEPMVSRQWFVKMKPLAEPAIEAAKDGRVRFVPERFTKTYLNWMENVRDWCISRQLWWGHRIPVWYCTSCDHMFASREDATSCPKCGGQVEQDPDVLDTWFSSALWSFSTMGWPEETPELKSWHPTSVLVTGYDIIFFWVARMIFMSLEFMGEEPFSDVLLHGLIRNPDGSKMSRSKGTGVNPLEIIEEYGADTLRFTLITGNTPGNDIRWRPEKVEASRNFCNKIWNASRFVMMNLEDFTLPEGKVMPEDLELNLADRWIISRMNRVAADITEQLGRYDMGEAARTIYDFVWGEYCDWYIEIAKRRLYGEDDPVGRRTAQYVLWKVLDGSLKMLHPFMPFITEGIWQHLPGSGESIMIEPWPTADKDEIDAVAEAEMAVLMETVRAIRNIRAEFNVEPGKKVDAIFHADGEAFDTINVNVDIVAHLAGLASVTVEHVSAAKPEKAAAAVVPGIEVYLPLAGMVDIGKETNRLRREEENLLREVKSARAKLSNEGFVTKAPAEVVQKQRDRLGEYEEQLVKIRARIAQLEG
ncbi:MAG TPA: valine--tRNA ligase [Bacillota bacterium]|nr:valine--tRNA ligase [Bacillota bacterium]HOK70024.1 valine--tRNA ligase [Bacillota bacterium]HPQ02167.1 valine--tRNA ligase [Bacillota bacterium]HPZ13025.1 valine--tRNA ligase [Bacillota bacterium]HQD79556.1 valine--tRNA ligase [Bacillota bacterium]